MIAGLGIVNNANQLQQSSPVKHSYFRPMIDPSALRIGNYILHKSGVRILPVKCDFQHFELLSNGMAKDMFPVALKACLKNL